MRARLRNLLPRAGVQYELFDCSVLLLVLGFVGYVLTDPPSNTDKALEAPFLLLDQQIWGALLTICAIVGIVGSYWSKALSVGYRVVTWACLFWSGSFFYGLLIGDASARALVSTFLYAWIARRLMREGDW